MRVKCMCESYRAREAQTLIEAGRVVCFQTLVAAKNHDHVTNKTRISECEKIRENVL